MESLNVLIGSIPVVELSPIYLNKLLVAAFVGSMLLVLRGAKKSNVLK